MKRKKHPHGYYHTCKLFIKNIKYYYPEYKIDSYEFAFNIFSLMRDNIVTYYDIKSKTVYGMPCSILVDISSEIKKMLGDTIDVNKVLMAYIKTNHKLRYRWYYVKN